jgi:hypothetical protein
MKPAELRALLGTLELTCAGLAKALQVSPRAVQYWVSESRKRPVPAWALAYLDLYDQTLRLRRDKAWLLRMDVGELNAEIGRLHDENHQLRERVRRLETELAISPSATFHPPLPWT